jgi:putative ABC transport system permease protein
MLVAFDRGRNIDAIDIAVEPGHDPETVARAIQAVLGKAFNVERPLRRGDRVAQMLAGVHSALIVSSLVALIAGAFLVVNTMSISVVQRKRELGILRALGATRRDVVWLLTLEGLLFGIVGSVLGVLIALGLSRGLLRTIGGAVSEIYLEQSSSVLEYEAWVLLSGLMLGVVSATCAAYLASRRSGAIMPSEALSSSTLASTPWEAGGRRTDLLALGLLIVSAILLQIPPAGDLPLGAFAAFLTLTVAGRALMPRLVRIAHGVLHRVHRRFGVAGVLASMNLQRDTARTAGTASGLMAGAALTICASTFITSYITSLNTWSAQISPGDLFVTSGAAVSGLSGRNTPMHDDLGRQLAAMPGIAQVRPSRSITIDYQGLPVKLESTDMTLFARNSRLNVLEGNESDAIRGMQAGGVVVSENFSRRFDVHPGSSIALSSKAGTHDFEVAAVVADYSSDLGLLRMDRATYIAHWNDTNVDTYELFVRPGADAEAERIKIDAQFGDRYDLFVLTNGEFRAELVNSARKIFSLMNVLEVITLVVAAMGMVTALLASVLDRIREIGVLRALGMLRAQVRNMVVVEAAFIGAIGTIGGIVLGLGLGYIALRKMAIVQTGWYLPYKLPLASACMLLAILVPLAAIAGLYPARRAARLSVRDALDYE